MRIPALILLTFSLPSFAMAKPPHPDWADLAELMSGEYTVVGRRPDSKTTFSGHLSFHARGKKLAFVRTINGETVRGTAFFDTLPDCNRPVLRLSFFQDGQLYLGLFEWNTDCGNYFRFTGYVGSKKTRAAGLETLFSDAARDSG